MFCPFLRSSSIPVCVRRAFARQYCTPWSHGMIIFKPFPLGDVLEAQSESPEYPVTQTAGGQQLPQGAHVQLWDGKCGPFKHRADCRPFRLALSKRKTCEVIQHLVTNCPHNYFYINTKKESTFCIVKLKKNESQGDLWLIVKEMYTLIYKLFRYKSQDFVHMYEFQWGWSFLQSCTESTCSVSMWSAVFYLTGVLSPQASAPHPTSHHEPTCQSEAAPCVANVFR